MRSGSEGSDGPGGADRTLHHRVAALLGREPQGAYEVVVLDDDGEPLVLRNEPLLDDGTPMPTRYWLLSGRASTAIGRLESEGGVRRAEAAVDPAALAEVHARYAAERDAAMPPNHEGPRPSGGVGGTRQGVKCLHAHYAHHLAGGDDPVGRWVEGELRATAGEASDGSGAAGEPIGAIDIGTNSVRVLVAVVDPDGVGLTTLARHMRITRLGQGVDASGALADAAVERTIEAMRAWRAVLDEHGVSRLRVAATSAVRDAANGAPFLEAVEAVVGARPEVLSGDEEARLSFAGATAGLDPLDGPFLVVDIGGGSTELAVGTTEPEGVRSIDVGCVRITERFLAHDPPLPEELANALAAVEYELDDVLRSLPGIASARRLIGLAGTVSTVAMVELGLIDYDRDAVHHLVLSKAAVEDVFRTLATEALADRLHNPGLEAERADVIVGGCVVLVRLLRMYGFEELLVSEADILDGLVLSQR